MNFRRVPFSHSENCRDLGGYATKDGVTRWNVFYRSACLLNFSQQDLRLLDEMNVGAIIDLRGGNNADENAGTPQNLVGIKRHSIPLGDGSIPYFAKMVPQSYMDMLENRQSVKKIFDVFADEPRAVLFHCFAGKDRTGVIASLLLSLAGVDDVDIVADYSLTYPYFLPRLRSDFSRTDAEKYVFVPIPEHMENFLNVFRKKFGSVQNYLRQIGVDDAQQSKILKKFVQTNRT